MEHTKGAIRAASLIAANRDQWTAADIAYTIDNETHAPAMLEACEQVSEWLDFLKQNYPDMPGLIRGVRAARAAIAQTES